MFCVCKFHIFCSLILLAKVIFEKACKDSCILLLGIAAAVSEAVDVGSITLALRTLGSFDFEGKKFKSV